MSIRVHKQLPMVQFVRYQKRQCCLVSLALEVNPFTTKCYLIGFRYIKNIVQKLDGIKNYTVFLLYQKPIKQLFVVKLLSSQNHTCNWFFNNMLKLHHWPPGVSAKSRRHVRPPIKNREFNNFFWVLFCFVFVRPFK